MCKEWGEVGPGMEDSRLSSKDEKDMAPECREFPHGRPSLDCSLVWDLAN